MPVLNGECVGLLATDAEGFVHVEMDYDFDMPVAVSAEVVARRCSEEVSRANNGWSGWTNRHATPPTKGAPPGVLACQLSPPRPAPPATMEPPSPQPPQASSAGDVSMCLVRAAELFPMRQLHKDEMGLSVPFQPICGESVQYLGCTQDGLLALSNYRLYHRHNQKGFVTIFPLMLIESVDIKDIFYMHILCKDARSLKCTFESGEQCVEWLRRVEALLAPPAQLEGLFAFAHRAWAAEPQGAEVMRRLANPPHHTPHHDFMTEFNRLEFGKVWRISRANTEFRLCPSYPPLLIVPANVSDDSLETVAKFRSSRRIPAVVWRHRGNGAVIARCSQPEVGWLGWRSNEDEQLLAEMAAACVEDHGSDPPAPPAPPRDPRRVLIVDARSYASAVTNRARGGGCECPQYYPCAEIQFMCLPNIHSVRKSFQALRALAAEPADIANWHSLLERTLWLQAIGGLLRTAVIVARAVSAGRPTLVHCSDGWDRTPQIVATAQLLLDPYYRTIQGFRVLVEKEWLDFGHKFADRCGHTVGSEDFNERCPVFLQWLDCVHQIQVQYPCYFEFSQAYLIKLAQHTYSCLFGTFLCNNRRERATQKVNERTFSVWRFLRGSAYVNHLYEPKDEAIYPTHCNRALTVWSAVYMGADPDTPAPLQPPAARPTTSQAATHAPPPTNGVMTKTRSYGDLLSMSEHGNTPYRRCSDPSITVDQAKLSSLSISGSNGETSNNNNSNEQPLIDEYSDDSAASDIILGQPIPNGNSSNYVQMQNMLNSTEGLINMTVPKQIVNGYSKSNGNIAILNGITDSNSNTKANLEYDPDFRQSDVYENGNTPSISENRLFIDSPDQIDGIAMEYAEQAVESVASSPEERPMRIVTKDGGVSFKSGNVILGLTPTEEGPVFIDGGISDLADVASNSGRIRNESVTWRSISECTDSSSGCVDLGAELNSSGGTQVSAEVHAVKGNSRRQRLDSVQNGGLNDTAAILLENEIGKLLSSEQAANRLSEHPNSVTAPHSGHRRQKSEGGSVPGGHFELFRTSPTSEDPNNCSDSTLCPNSPLRAFRTQSAGAAGLGRWQHGRSISVPLAPAPVAGGELEASPCRLCGPQLEGACWGGHCTRRTPDTMHRRECAVSNGSSNTAGALDLVDGLVCPQSPIQHRLHQIILDHKLREEALMRELHAARVELLQRACRTARQTPDHTDDVGFEPEHPARDWSSDPLGYMPLNLDQSLYPSPGGNGKIRMADDYWDCYPGWESGGSSISNGVRWVPDHAVSRCTRCDTHFWLGKRKHHCRSCGGIFCAECSENSAPLPAEQLYSPVRVCAECYVLLAPSNTHTQAPTEGRHMRDFNNCKQSATSEQQKLTSTSQVTTASN